MATTASRRDINQIVRDIMKRLFLAIMIVCGARGLQTSKRHWSKTMCLKLSRAPTQFTIDDSVCSPTDRELLESVVIKHCKTLDLYKTQKPISTHTRDAFQDVLRYYKSHGSNKPIVLDSGCGTGRSTLLLGSMYPDHFVIGVDKSLARLNRNSVYRDGDGVTSSQDQPSPNAVLVRAELSDFWRCCLDANLVPTKHYLLYPNPYPKKARLKNRWYSHPSFPLLLQLGGDIVVRSNWKGYLEELALSVKYAEKAQLEEACRYLEAAEIGPVPTSHDVPWTNFEKKYFDCGEPTYELDLFRSQS